MKGWSQFLRIALLLLIGAFLTLGTTAVSRTASGSDAEFALAGLALVFLLPAILQCIFLVHPFYRPLKCDGEKTSREGPKTADITVVYSLFVCLAFWLGWLVLGFAEGNSVADDSKQLAIAFLVTLFVLIMVHVFVAARLGPTCQVFPDGFRHHSGLKRWMAESMHRPHRLLRSGGVLLCPPLLISFGSVLVLASPVAFSGGVDYYRRLFSERWITAEYGLSEHLTSLRPSIDVLGRGLYLGAMVLAGLSLVAILAKLFRPTSRVISGAQSKMAWAAGILSAYSILDMYFGWVGAFHGEGAHSVWLWALFSVAVFLFGTLIALAATAAVPHKNSGGVRFLGVSIPLFAPLLCANTVVVSPLLTPGLADLRGISTLYFGLQFLTWGWVEMAVPHEVTYAKCESETSSDTHNVVIRNLGVSA